LSIEEFKSWLRPDPNSMQQFKCLACNRSYALSNKGISAINETHGHTKVSQHQERLRKKRKSIFHTKIKSTPIYQQSMHHQPTNHPHPPTSLPLLTRLPLPTPKTRMNDWLKTFRQSSEIAPGPDKGLLYYYKMV